MLDFYATGDGHPFPDDLPADHVSLGGMDVAEYHSCADVIHPCLAKVGVEASYFSDWLLPPEQHAEVLRCLLGAKPDMADEGQRALGDFVAIIRRAAGFTLLAVSD